MAIAASSSTATHDRGSADGRSRVAFVVRLAACIFHGSRRLWTSVVGPTPLRRFRSPFYQHRASYPGGPGGGSLPTGRAGFLALLASLVRFPVARPLRSLRPPPGPEACTPGRRKRRGLCGRACRAPKDRELCCGLKRRCPQHNCGFPTRLLALPAGWHLCSLPPTPLSLRGVLAAPPVPPPARGGKTPAPLRCAGACAALRPRTPVHPLRRSAHTLAEKTRRDSHTLLVAPPA